MRSLIVALLIMSMPAWAATNAPGCGTLCGSWQLDPARSDAVPQAVDAALTLYREPRDKRGRERNPDDAVRQIEAEMENSLGPIHDRLGGADLRAELLKLLAAPKALTLATRGAEITIRGDSSPERRLSPGESHARVDAIGTAKIRSGWEAGRLTISERYDRRHQYIETYMVQRPDGSLLVTREVRRPGLKPMLLRSVYRRA